MILTADSKFDLGQKVYHLFYVAVYEDRMCPRCEGEGAATFNHGAALVCTLCHGAGRKSENIGNRLVSDDSPSVVQSIKVTFDSVRKSYHYRIRTPNRGKYGVITVTQSELETEENLAETLERRNRPKE